MRKLYAFLLGAGLLLPGLGCWHTCQHTAGVCDYDPPPVESLLIAPSPGHSSMGVYANSIQVAQTPAQSNLPPLLEPLKVMPKLDAK